MKTDRRNFIEILGGLTIASSIPNIVWGKNIPNPNLSSDLKVIPQQLTTELKFHTNGKFKIAQFTDTHFIYNDPKADPAVACVNEILDKEKPDLAVFTGDVIYGKPAKEGMETILNLASKRKIPFAVTLGNHDADFRSKATPDELLQIIQAIPYNLTNTVKGISGTTNFILPILSSDGTHASRILYFFDSHAYSQIKDVKGYDYIKRDQIEWYCQQSKKYTTSNGGTPIPSLAFFHIPLPEYKQAATDENAVLFGIRKESICSSQLNSGLFTAMKNQGDIEGTFVGHDHNNDFAVLWHGILLAYGRYSGGDTVYNDLPNGTRIIELTENVKGFRTWIRLKNDIIENDVVFPDSFLSKD